MENNHLNRIYTTQNYIEQNFNSVISVQNLEIISCYSYRNLQRIFYSLFKETIGAYQTRLKVENGYKLLLYSKKQISIIALEVGFSDVQSFSKAFKKHFNFSPLLARKEKLNLFIKNNYILKIESNLKPEIQFLPELKVNYLSCKTNYNNLEIEKVWNKILDYDVNPHSSKYYGIISDDILITSKTTCNYDACIYSDKIVKNVPNKLIFNQKYATFYHKGNYNTIEKTYAEIYGGWILENQIEFSHLPIIEQYILHDSNTKLAENYLTSISIPIL